jgi:hypothetical protein
MVKILTIGRNEISIVSPNRRSTNAGSEKGTRRVEMTTMTNTNKAVAFKRPEMKGATTPVEIPDRSKTGRAYSGQMAWVIKKRPTGMMKSLRMHRNKIIEEVLLIFFRTSTKSIFRKLRNSKNIWR